MSTDPALPEVTVVTEGDSLTLGVSDIVGVGVVSGELEKVATVILDGLDDDDDGDDDDDDDDGGAEVLVTVDGLELGVRLGNEKDVDVDVKAGVEINTSNCQQL